MDINNLKISVEVQNAKRLSELLQKATDQLEQLEKTVDEINAVRLMVSINHEKEPKPNMNALLAQISVSALGITLDEFNKLDTSSKAFIFASLLTKENANNKKLNFR